MSGQPQPTSSMFTSPLLRWGFIFSVAAIALSVATRLQQQPVVNLSHGNTYCYQNVRTNNHLKTAAQCFTVKDGIFTRVWSDENPGSQEETHGMMREGFVIPGIWDGHGHLMAYGEFLHSVDLFGAKSIDEARDRIKAYVKKNPGAGTKHNWIRGVGWDQDRYGRMPTAADLEEDDSLKGLYAMLDRIDVHCSWVSQSVLDLMPSDMPDVPGGEIIRDPGMGVFCDNAMDNVVKLWPKPGHDKKSAAVKTAMQNLNELGIVGIHDASTLPDDIKLYTEMAETDDWTVRVYGMLECTKRNSFCPEEAVKIHRNDSMFTIRSVKLFADGALGSWGSAMLDPYNDRPNTKGSLLVSAEDLKSLTRTWSEHGFQVNIHAIGDLANQNAVDAIVNALKFHCEKEGWDPRACQHEHRFRIEHAQILHPKDQERISAFAIIPSIQPTHATSDMKYALERLGPERTDTRAYRMRSLHDDVLVILGSDFPVEPPNPFHGVYAAVTRKNPATGLGRDGSEKGWHTDQALTVDEALRGFSNQTGYGAFLEDKAGVIKEGALADWVVLDQNIDGLDIEEFRHLRVRETWVNGKRVYARED